MKTSPVAPGDGPGFRLLGAGMAKVPPVRGGSRPEFPSRALEHQRHLDAWRDGHRNPRCVWTRSDANTIPISTDRNHTHRPLAKRGTILKVS